MCFWNLVPVPLSYYTSVCCTKDGFSVFPRKLVCDWSCAVVWLVWVGCPFCVFFVYHISAYEAGCGIRWSYVSLSILQQGFQEHFQIPFNSSFCSSWDELLSFNMFFFCCSYVCVHLPLLFWGVIWSVLENFLHWILLILLLKMAHFFFCLSPSLLKISNFDGKIYIYMNTYRIFKCG